MPLESRNLTVNGLPISHRPRTLGMLAHYQCGDSGQCCGNWSIQIKDDEKKRIERAAPRLGMTQDEVRACFRPDKEPGRHLLQLTEDEKHECAFRQYDESGCGSCRIHAVSGHESLPETCQTYPRQVLATPSGFYITLSYTCPTARGLLLEDTPLQEVSGGDLVAHHTTLRGHLVDETIEPAVFCDGVKPDWAAQDYFWRWAAQWMARPALTPSEALYWLGMVVGQIEKIGEPATRMDVLESILDQFMDLPPDQLKARCAEVAPNTELGITYLKVYLNVLQGVGKLSKAMSVIREILDYPVEHPERLRITTAYDEQVRPRLAEFEALERRYLTSRVFPNPLIYGLTRLRTAYFLIVLSMIQVRMGAMMHSLIGKQTMSSDHWLESIRELESKFVHTRDVTRNMANLLEPRGDLPPIQHLAEPALF